MRIGNLVLVEWDGSGHTTTPDRFIGKILGIDPPSDPELYDIEVWYPFRDMVCGFRRSEIKQVFKITKLFKILYEV